MTTILEYSINNIDNITSYSQDSFSWEKYSTSPLIDIHDFQSCIAEIPIVIGRENILNTYREKKFYKAFVMTMLWGNIGTQPNRKSKGDKRTTSAFKAFSTSKETVDFRIKLIQEKIDNGDIKTAYRYLKNDYKFPGIDISFFTKILSFLSEVSLNNQNLLIYDKWTKLIHIHILLDNNIDPLKFYTKRSISNLYKKGTNDKYRTELIQAKTGQDLNAYLNYINVMKDLTQAISLETNKTITPFQLESYLFGKSLKSNRNLSNPRYWIQQNFACEYLINFI
jgi:hypothetical protein